ncbi:protein translocase subunit secE/sec61 gamma [Novosphingobium nitrogenifigens DSM 19370]|uniref:Protein translocase subunit SecE n=1 Tax=Novosphingobium nitrogenifigens DSM 19370 TaxID=983920 RepID=F1Z5Z0_9SPHN|nr:preprotein translocase subunit SecE [Novosphingobium nitrogenifigens]EGD59954.1 protein translocase subunit secE/sec61 gamma [Novosphingobium nitrogenifigens DSM 19370]
MAKTSPNEFFNQVKAEARKVVWPTRQETTSTAIFVALMMVLLSVFFLGIDSLFGYVVKILLSLAS